MTTTIFQALAAVMGDVQAVGKGDRNTVQGFNFRGIDAVTNAVGPVLRKHGVIVVPEVLDYQYGTVEVGQGTKARSMGHARLTIAFTWYGPAGDSIRSVAAGEAFDSGDKATPKAHSVAFRTAMIQTLCLPTDEPDPDAESHERAPRGARPPQNGSPVSQRARATNAAVAPSPADEARGRLREACAEVGLDLVRAVAMFAEAYQGQELKTSTDAVAIDALTNQIRDKAKAGVL